MIKEYNNITESIEEHTDICVIGSGAGGAVIAKELAEKGLDVVLLDEGSYFTHRNFNQNSGDMISMMYRDNGLTLSMGIPPVNIPVGKAIGGTTIINSATCFRTPEKVIRKWVESYDCQGLVYEDFIPYFDKVEKELNVCELSEDVLGNVFKIVKRGAEKLGLQAKGLLHNVKNCEAAGMCQWGCIKKAKQSTDITYIPKALEAKARIYANCKVTKFDIVNGRVQSVHGVFIDPNTQKKTFTMNVRSSVVCLAMGALCTPAFLLKRMIANSSGQVGRNLTIHPCGRVVAEMDEIVNGHQGVSQGGLIDAFKDEGIMLEGIFIPPGIMTLALPGIGQDHKYIAKHYKNMAAFGALISDTSRGRIFPGFPGFAFTAVYSINQYDIERLRKAFYHIAEIFFAAGAKRVFTSCSKMPVLNSVKDLNEFKTIPVKARHFEIMGFHPLGTCRMGNNPCNSVVNLNLETHDIKGLFITDGSVFPTSLGVNPQISIMSFVTKTADYIANNFDKYKKSV